MTPCPDYRQTLTHLRSRRDALRGLAGLALAGLSSAVFPGLRPRLAFGNTTGGTRDILVCIFLRGGADGLSIVAPYGDGAHYYDNRPTIAIPAPGPSATAGLDLDGYFALHPSLSGLKPLYDAGSFAIVEATGSMDPTRSHFDAQRFMEQATPGDKSTFSGWIARHLANLAVQNGAPLRSVGFGGYVPASLRGVNGVNSIAIDRIDDFGLNTSTDDAPAMQAALAAM